MLLNLINYSKNLHKDQKAQNENNRSHLITAKTHFHLFQMLIIICVSHPLAPMNQLKILPNQICSKFKGKEKSMTIFKVVILAVPVSVFQPFYCFLQKLSSYSSTFCEKKFLKKTKINLHLLLKIPLLTVSNWYPLLLNAEEST